MRLTREYVTRRLVVFLAVVFVAATINFLIPRLAPGDPMMAMLQRMSYQGASLEGTSDLVNEYREMFGLDESLFVQYVRYWAGLLRFDFGYSLAHFPVKVNELLLDALPWSMGLLTVTTLLSFAIGTVMGALAAWKNTGVVKYVVPVLMVLAAIPYYLVALFLLYFLSYSTNLFPASGAYSVLSTPGFSWSFIKDLISHATLPALSIIISGMGFWALGMRGLMISVLGDDYLVLAEAKGLTERRILWRYAVRNAILPQVTGLAMSLGGVVSGAVIVEAIFAYPGIGWLLYSAIGNSDYTLIQGITFFLVLSVATSVLILDLVYPWIDPRIIYENGGR